MTKSQLIERLEAYPSDIELEFALKVTDSGYKVLELLGLQLYEIVNLDGKVVLGIEFKEMMVDEGVV